ncbi:DUF7522 family protein [Halorussus halophilus]|uniref:DUF7522 family protein n=1 Tax=Halorussus halophilus TaxID=2650975 RepID=UPI00130106BB|nr:hypothetical protein [Halorussus halophilus]
MGDLISETLADELTSACRTAVGDELRSITYFTDEGEEQIYLRGDLESDADLVGFADNERLGFRSQSVYTQTELGEHRFIIRVFDHGFLTRVIVGDHGAFVTTDEMAMTRFEELAKTVETVLREHSA